MQSVYVRLFVAVALLVAGVSANVQPTVLAQTPPPSAPCSTTARNCLFIPLMQRSALTIERIATLPGNATAVTTSNGYAYVGMDGTLRIVDVHTPAAPRVVGHYPLPGQYIPSVTRVVQQGIHVYATTRYIPTLCCVVGNLLVLDVQQPNMPKLIGSAQNNGMSNLAVNGKLTYVTGEFRLSETPELLVYDVSNPNAPTLRSSTGSRGSSAVAVTGNTAYVATNGGGIDIYDVSNPALPTLQTTTVLSYVHDMAIANSYLYAANTNGITVFDISTPRSPRLVGQIATGGIPQRIHIVNGRVFVAQGEAGIAVVDVTQPDHPQFLTSYDTPGLASDVVVDGDIVYVADGDAGLQLLRLVP